MSVVSFCPEEPPSILAPSDHKVKKPYGRDCFASYGRCSHQPDFHIFCQSRLVWRLQLGCGGEYGSVSMVPKESKYPIWGNSIPTAVLIPVSRAYL